MTTTTIKPWCRDPDCREAAFSRQLVDREDGSGLHIGCTDPATDGGPCTEPWCHTYDGFACGHPIDEHIRVHGPGILVRSRGPFKPTNPTTEEVAITAPAVLANPFAAVPGPHPFKRELIDIIRWSDANTSRSLQQAIGPSEIGVTCLRRIAYKVSGAPAVNDVSDPWFAIVGTAVHDWLAFALNDYQRRVLGRGPDNPRFLIEQRVRVEADENGVSGNTDAFDVDHGRVCDWKIVGNDSLRNYQTNGPSDQYRVQAHTYGRGWELLGYPVREVLIAFLPRSNYLDRAHIWSEPYDRQVALDALSRLHTVRALTAALPVASIPATVDVKGCGWCDHFRPGQPADATGCPGPGGTTTSPGA